MSITTKGISILLEIGKSLTIEHLMHTVRVHHLFLALKRMHIKQLDFVC